MSNREHRSRGSTQAAARRRARLARLISPCTYVRTTGRSVCSSTALPCHFSLSQFSTTCVGGKSVRLLVSSSHSHWWLDIAAPHLPLAISTPSLACLCESNATVFRSLPRSGPMILRNRKGMERPPGSSTSCSMPTAPTHVFGCPR